MSKKSTHRICMSTTWSMQLLRGECIAHKEAPGVVVLYTDSAAEDEGDLDSLPDGNYDARTLEENERHHCSDLKDRYRQRRDHTRQLVA